MSELNHDAAPTWSLPSIRARAPGYGSRPHRLAASALLPCLLATSCVAIGPTVEVSPGLDKSQAAFAADRAYCGQATDEQLQPVANQLNGSATTADQVAVNNQRIQGDYNHAFGECMAARGNVVPAMAPSGSQPLPAVPDSNVQPADQGSTTSASSLPIRSGRWTQAASCADPAADDSANRRMFGPGQTSTAHDGCHITIAGVIGNHFSTRLACRDLGGEDNGPVVEISAVMTVISPSAITWESLNPEPETTTYRYCGAH
jgi:hypothetical protein